MTKPNFIAEELIRDLELTTPFIPRDACEGISTNSFVIEYQEKAFDSEKICGFSMKTDRGAAIVVNSNMSTSLKEIIYSCA